MTEYPTYMVGGAVRDYYVHIARVGRNQQLRIHDIDFAVEAPTYQEMLNYVQAMDMKVVVQDPQFGRLKAAFWPDVFLGQDSRAYEICRLATNGQVYADFVLTRKDGKYFDGRRPSEVQAATIQEDLQRRDFTMNSMALDVKTGDLLDPHNGRRHISERKVQFNGVPVKRIVEDYLRVIRYYRFQATLGFSGDVIADLTLRENQELIGSALSNSVSKERVYEELRRMLSTMNPVEFMDRCSNIPRGILQAMFVFQDGGIMLEPRLNHLRD